MFIPEARVLLSDDFTVLDILCRVMFRLQFSLGMPV